MLNWIKGMFGWSVIDEVEERPVTEVKAKAPAKTGGKKKGELSMTPTAIKQREARAKAKAVTQ
tara:strand:- start:8017 stop:8205 length:189 start_codon:yes stop_codon:yes gene_type:complete